MPRPRPSLPPCSRRGPLVKRLPPAADRSVDVALCRAGGGAVGAAFPRLAGRISEGSQDDAGIVWPDSVAPFLVGLINLKPGEAAVDQASEALYQRLTNAGIPALHDDVDQRAGAKFATMDLIGLPWQVIAGPKGIARGEVEIRRRATGEREALGPEAGME